MEVKFSSGIRYCRHMHETGGKSETANACTIGWAMFPDAAKTVNTGVFYREFSRLGPESPCTLPCSGKRGSE